MPPSRQPQNAMIHSGRFSLQKTTLSPFCEPERLQARGECARTRADLFVRVRSRAKAVVVDEKVAASTREIVEKVDERVAGHD